MLRYDRKRETRRYDRKKKMRDDRKRGGYDGVKMTTTDRGKHNRVEKVRRTTRNKNIKERRKNIFYYFLS
jgi:hypothetical protein